MAHFLFNASGSRADALAQLRGGMWAIGDDERYRDELAPGDLVLIHVSSPENVFVGLAEIATAVRRWGTSEAEARSEGAAGGVSLSAVEEWERAVPLATVVHVVDPTGSNPVVLDNARAGFRGSVVRMTEGEYEAALRASREHQAT
jgi:hypothetical protein